MHVRPAKRHYVFSVTTKYIADCNMQIGRWSRVMSSARRQLPYVLVDVVLILHVSLMNKITVKLFTIISTYSPLAAEKSRGTIDCVTADQPYNGACCTEA